MRSAIFILTLSTCLQAWPASTLPVRTLPVNIIAKYTRQASIEIAADTSQISLTHSNVVLCPAITLPTGNIQTPYTKESDSFIATTSSTTATTSLATTNVIFDADPNNGYVLLNPGFIAAPNNSGSFIAQAFNGCQAGVPSKMSPSALIEGKSEMIAIFPNPTNNALNLVMENGLINNFTIITPDGREIIKKEINNQKEYNFNVSNLSNGTYSILIQAADGVIFTRNFIKN